MSEREPSPLRRAIVAVRRGGVAELALALRRRRRLAQLRSMDSARQYRAFLRRHFGHGIPNARPCDARWKVFVLGASGDAGLDATRASLREAGAPATLELVPPGTPLPPAGDVDFVTAVAAGDRFVPGALAALTHAARHAGADVLSYADEDRVDSNGERTRPLLKPAWSPLLSLTWPGTYPGSPAAVPAALFHAAQGASEAPHSWVSLVLGAAAAADRVCHLPVPLLSRVDRAGDPLLGTEAHRLDAARASQRRRGWGVDVEPGDRPGIARLRGVSAATATISVIVPTRDLPDLFVPLADELVRRREESRLELIFVDHLTTDPRAAAQLTALASSGAARVLRDDGPFNYSRLVNRGAREATGELLLLLNNDVELPRENWIEPLARAATLPGVAAAGTLLRYPDGIVQHGGIALGIGTVAGHLGKRDSVRHDLPWVGVDVAREVSAATAACLMIRREDFVAAGGFDERELGVSYNDVDFCLRLQAAGRRVVYEPAAALVHHETKTRDPVVDPRETRAVRERWGRRLDEDPYVPPGAWRLDEEAHLELWDRRSFLPRVLRADGTALDA